MVRGALPSARRSSAALWLAPAWAALVLYASLFPFTGWRWPPGQTLATLAWLPRSVYQDDFDIYSNLFGYMPLGALLAVALHRPGVAALRAFVATALLGTALSYGCELLQHFVPGRVPAVEDLAMNAAGTAIGALAGLALHALGLVRRWRALRERWFAGEGTFVFALLLLWPVGLLFPAPVPLGLGQVGERLREWGAAVLDEVPWAAPAHALLSGGTPAVAPLRPLAEMLIVAMGLLAPCLLAYAVTSPGLRRVVIALGALALGIAGMTLSTLLNFGPQNAWTWLTPATLPGLGLGLLLALLLVPLPRRLAPALGLMALTGLVVGVAQAPADPYFAQSLRAWEQGRFVRFHGMAQWIGWLWPYVAMGWLLVRVARRPAGP